VTSGGDDDLYGNEDDDLIRGGPGEDWHAGGTGQDKMVGGDGDMFDAADGEPDRVFGGAGWDGAKVDKHDSDTSIEHYL
jgi:hypothetical protein